MDGPLEPGIDDDQLLTAQLHSGLNPAYPRSSWTRPGLGRLTQGDRESNVGACCDLRRERLVSVLGHIRKRERSWLVQRYRILSCAISTVTSRSNRLYPHPQSYSFAGVAPMWVGTRTPAVRYAVRRSKHRLVSVAPSEPCVHTLLGNLGLFDKMQRQTLVGDPQPWCRRTDHATSQRTLQGPNEGDEGGGGRIKDARYWVQLQQFSNENSTIPLICRDIPYKQ